jgi:hypothetical protein
VKSKLGNVRRLSHMTGIEFSDFCMIVLLHGALGGRGDVVNGLLPQIYIHFPRARIVASTVAESDTVIFEDRLFADGLGTLGAR